MEDLLKKVMKDKIKEQKKQNAKNIEEQKKKINTLLEDCNCILCATNKGVAVCGAGGDVLALYSAMATALHKNGVSKKMLIDAVEIGVKEADEDEDEEDDSNDFIKEMLTALKEVIEEISDEEK